MEIVAASISVHWALSFRLSFWRVTELGTDGIRNPIPPFIAATWTFPQPVIGDPKRATSEGVRPSICWLPLTPYTSVAPTTLPNLEQLQSTEIRR